MDLAKLLLESSGLTAGVLWLLLVAAGSVWVLAAAKARQLARVFRAEGAFEVAVRTVTTRHQLEAALAKHHNAPGAHVLRRLCDQTSGDAGLLEAVGASAVASEQRMLGQLLPLLGTIASTAPFVGLLGTVWGILDAFHRIGTHGSADLAVVAPAIGEALVATALGLIAAIPAVVAYNALARRLGELVGGLSESSRVWAHRLAIAHREGHW